MPDKPGRYRTVVVAGWLVLILAGLAYALIKSVPAWIAVPAVVAFLIEFPFYLLPGFASARNAFARRGKTQIALLLALSSIAPWMVCAVFLGSFRVEWFLIITFIAFAISFWYVLLPANPVADILYVVLLGAILLSKVFSTVYPEPLPKIDLSIFGHLMLIRTGALSLLCLRGGIQFDTRIFPARREWLAGLRWFLYLAPAATGALWLLHAAALRPNPPGVLTALATFIGIFLVVAYSEEFFFRGLLQKWLEDWTASAIAGILLSSLVFGAVHLGFHDKFPNWRFAIAAAVLGLFCALARRATGGIQAGMVTHALAATIFRIYFQ